MIWYRDRSAQLGAMEMSPYGPHRDPLLVRDTSYFAVVAMIEPLLGIHSMTFVSPVQLQSTTFDPAAYLFPRAKTR